MSRIVGKFNLKKINDLENFFKSGIFQHDSINKKGTKIKEKTKYNHFIEVLKKILYLEQDDYIIPFFAKKNIFIPEIIINGYIQQVLNEQENTINISLINKILPFMMQKKYFFLIYKKLAKIYRKLNIFDVLNKKEINTFEKVFNIWKIFFSYDDVNNLSKKYIYLYGNNAIKINIPEISNNYMLSIVDIFLFKSPLFHILNKNKNDFSFISLYQKDKKGNKKEICEIKYKDIINQKEEDIKEVKFIIHENKISYIINNQSNIRDIKIDTEKIVFNRIKLLKNFNGKISYIEIIRQYSNNKENKIGIKPGKNDLNVDYLINENEKIEIKMKYNNSNIFYKYYPEILYDNIKYYGGFESFIPIMKIFYKLFLFTNKSKDKENINKIKDLYKSFFKILINITHFSESNLLNFHEIIIPLIAALSEIDEVIPDKLIKDEIYKDTNFINLYILIMTSPCSKNAKNIFRKIFGIDNNKINFTFLDFKISEKILLKYNNSLDWYCFMIFMKIEFIILVTNDVNKIPKGFISILANVYNSVENNIYLVKNIPEKNKSQLKSMIQLFFAILNNFYENKMNFPINFRKIKDFNLLGFIQDFQLDEEYLISIIFRIMKIMLILNKSGLIQFEDKNKNISDECSFSKFYILFLSLKGIFHIKNINVEKLKNYFFEMIKPFPENKSLILEILDENEDINFITEEENIMKEIVDFHGQYRHLMKELFIFNRPWSKEKLFFSSKKDQLKFKNINYYTNNFQRPILYPMLDYTYQYPTFSFFKIDNNFYLKEENNDKYINEYDFDFQSKRLDKLNDELFLELITNIEKKYIENIQIFDACYIKRTHHIRGKFFIVMINGLLKKIYFYIYSKSQNEKLCHGSLFHCPLKDMNRKICLELNDIRLIMRRIYFYKKTGIEFFTKSKSYYFHFDEKNNGENVCQIIINLLVYYSQNELYPININGNIIGYSRIIFNNDKFKGKDDLIFIKNQYIYELINHWIKINKNNNLDKTLSSFDALIFLNLLSNRSYNDIYQYPVFPLLFFYDINTHNKIERNLGNHIGFQVNSLLSEKRQKKIINNFKLKKDEIENGLNKEENAYYFESSFSNINYVCNYLIRIFPYSFIAIELQGDGYDNKNIFHSIEETFYDISYKENDLRELIPEFFYFPEIFLNINKLNFNKNNDNKYINDVKIPEEFLSEKKDDNDNDKVNTFYYYCKFVSKMRESLENNYMNIFKWKDLIFGEKQKYMNNSEKNVLFKPEKYISFDSDKNISLDEHKNIINNIEFGLLPIQIIDKGNEKNIK